MLAQINYSNGRISWCDSDRFSAMLPFGTYNMLTNLELHFDGLGSESLWLYIHYYDALPEYKDGLASGETAVAHRKQGWRFLLVDDSEMNQVEEISVDGTLYAWRQGGVLIDGRKFHSQERLCYSGEPTASLNSKAIAIHDYLANAYPSLALDEDALCRQFGFTQSAYQAVLEQERMQPDEIQSDGGDWLTDIGTDE